MNAEGDRIRFELHRTERVVIVARDGTRLHTKVVRPRTDDPVPTIVTRTPYPIGWLLRRDCRKLARHGYACIWQDVRGQGRSDGQWEPFVHEQADGQDTMTWIREQPWSDGQIAWVGDSYLAGTGWAVTMDGAHGVTTLVSRVFAPSLRTAAFEGPLVRHDVLTAWMISMPNSEGGPFLKTPAYHRALDHRPRATMDEAALGMVVPWFRDVVQAETDDHPFWHQDAAGDLEAAGATTDVPVLLIGGWSDPFVEAQARAWARLPRRDESLWVIGPWAHLGQAPSGVRLRHRRAEGGGLGQGELTQAWFDAHLKSGEAPPTGVRTYVVGGDRWEHRADWPPPTVARPWSLVPTADAGRCGGTLVPGVHPLPHPVTWTYDPSDPLPSRGGAGSLAGAVPLIRGTKPGFVKVKDRCGDRTDVWRFESAPLEAPLHVAGTVRMDLSVASSAEDTAFGFRLLIRPPHGRARMIREGFATLPLPYPSGSVVEVRPDGQPIEFEVPAGWSLVLVLTSSSFPAVEAHPNVVGPLAWATETVVAEQHVLDATLWLPEVQP